jgi:DNA polymerase-3 subunit epsilon
VLFGYDAEGRITGVEERLDQLEDPGRPIPPEITALTGIRDEDVEGRRIDEGRVLDLVTRADLVVAHNAAFDRAFLERRLSVFTEQPWACSANDVPWRAAGMESRKLEFLAYRSGVFYDGHRAENDCLAGVHVLAQELPDLGGTAMAALLRAARRTDVLFRAVGSPFETKDLLKARGYRWRADAKVWWRHVPADEAEAERAWLAREIYGGRSRAEEVEVTAYRRYSPRLR